MDMACFFGDEKTSVNFVSATVLEKCSFESLRNNMKRIFKELPKTRCKIVELFGDYYYKFIDEEEALAYCVQKIKVPLKDEADINNYVSNNINVPMPLHKPQFQLFFQEEYGPDKNSMFIFKSHHSLCDGVSIMQFHLL